jgi:hypothetical protein
MVGGGVGVNVVPHVPIQLGGVGNAATVRAMFDLEAWIMGLCVSLGRVP